MKNLTKRSVSFVLVVVLCLSLLSGVTLQANAANYVANWGYRGVTATYLSEQAQDFYEDNNTSYELLAQYAGSSYQNQVPSSPLYGELQDLMVSNHDHITSYDETRYQYCYTDCQGGNATGPISSFYSGREIGPDWDGGDTWNREHCWPRSKCINQSKKDDSADIMTLRPTSKQENSSRGNTAYGESGSFFDPNDDSNGQYNVHGDVARLVLYNYVRWGNTSYMWGSSGVMESQEVLFKWMEEDPVDTWELGRNDAVESITGTRNVFVDYPELAYLMFNRAIPSDMPTPSGKGSENGYKISVTVNDADFGSVVVSGTTITATPADGYMTAGFTVVTGTAEVAQNGNVFRVNPTSDCTVCINFAPRTSATVTYYQDGATVATDTAWTGDAVTVPQHSGSAPEGYTFRGWVTASLEETSNAPQSVLLPGTEYTVIADTQLYALYSRVDGTTGEAAQLYVKHTGAVTEGDYLVVFLSSGNHGAMKAELSSKNRLNYLEITVSGDTVTAPDASIVWHIAPASSGSWTIYNAETGKYVASPTDTDGNYIALVPSVTTQATWTPSTSNGTYEFTNDYRAERGLENRLLRRNDTYGFSCYRPATGAALTLYKGQTGTTYYTTSITPPAQLESVVLKEQPAKLSYLEGKDQLDVTGGMLELTYDDESTKEIPLTNAMVTGFDNTQVGRQELTVSYGGFTLTFTVEVKAKTLTSIAVSSLPEKLGYLQNKETLDVTGGKVTLYYDNGTTAEVELTENMVMGFDNTVLGKNTLTVTYAGKTATFDVQIEPKSLSSISLTNLPTKLTYLEGKDTLDLSGGKVTLYYNDGTEEEIDLTENMVTGFDNTRVGQQELTVTLGEKTDSFHVQIQAKSLTSIAVTTQPVKTQYRQNRDELNVTGGKLTLSYNNDTTDEIDLTLAMVTGFENATVGTKTLTVTYQGKTTTFTVEVVEYSGPAVDENTLILPLDQLEGAAFVWVDGVKVAVESYDNDGYIQLPNAEGKVLTTFTYNAESQDPHEVYPTGMKVWLLDYEEGYTAKYVPELDNLLRYAGSSIRITGKKGIRMITGLDKTLKATLIKDGVEGYKLVEYGTVLGWQSLLESGEALVLGKEYAKSNYAYKKGAADPIFFDDGKVVQFTNVLVGFNNDQCKDDIAMRPYLVLEDAEGNQITVYGGIVYRSIGYIAYQNRTVFQPKTNAYNFVWEIIHHVYGDQYDADFKG